MSQSDSSLTSGNEQAGAKSCAEPAALTRSVESARSTSALVADQRQAGHVSEGPPRRLAYFTEEGEPITTLPGMLLELAMMGRHPDTSSPEEAERQVQICQSMCWKHNGAKVLRHQVIACAAEAKHLGVVHPTRGAEALVTAMANLPPQPDGSQSPATNRG